MNFFERIGISLALLFLALFACHSVATYNTRWHFSRFGLPETLVAADGVSYPDGKPISPPTLRAYRSGQEAMEWAILLPSSVGVVACLCQLAWEQVQDTKRLKMKGNLDGVLLDELTGDAAVPLIASNLPPEHDQSARDSFHP